MTLFNFYDDYDNKMTTLSKSELKFIEQLRAKEATFDFVHIEDDPGDKKKEPSQNKLMAHKIPGVKQAVVSGKDLGYNPFHSSIPIDPMNSKAMRSAFFPAGKIYQFIGRTTAGVAAGPTPFPVYFSVSSSPAGGITDANSGNTPLNEWTTFQALFDEYRTTSMYVYLTMPPLATDTGADAAAMGVLGNAYSPEASNALSTTASTRFNSIRQYAEAKPVSCPMTATTVATQSVIVKAKTTWKYAQRPVPQLWDSTVSPTTNAYGSIEYCRNEVTSSAQKFGCVWVEYRIQFRNRF